MSEGDQQFLKEKKTYSVNGEKLTESEFQERKETLEHQPGTKLVEVAPYEYVIRIQG